MGVHEIRAVSYYPGRRVPVAPPQAAGPDVRSVRTVGHARVVTTMSATGPSPPDAPTAWSPLRIVAFRALWLAQLASMIGTWMQTVGAQWLLIDEPDAATLVSLVQTASLLPMLLLALPAGVLADSFDRRRLLVGLQLVTLVVGGVLTALTALGDISPPVLLALTFLIGCGQAMSMPPWQALIPDLVPTRRGPRGRRAGRGEHEPRARRRTGPRRPADHAGRRRGWCSRSTPRPSASWPSWSSAGDRRGRVSGDVPERFGPALRAGARYVRHSRVVRRLLLRSAAVRPSRHGHLGAAPARRQPAAGARVRRLRDPAGRARRRRGRRGVRVAAAARPWSRPA